MADPSASPLRQRTTNPSSSSPAFALGPPVNAPSTEYNTRDTPVVSDDGGGKSAQEQVRVPLPPSASPSSTPFQSSSQSQPQSPYDHTHANTERHLPQPILEQTPLRANIDQIKLPISNVNDGTILGLPISTLTVAIVLIGTVGMGWYGFNTAMSNSSSDHGSPF
ncbi:hypothetical protein IAR55_001036 [Kwoniella newhampshirensis]|uniref:Uncharacterized protein n=1 Tax=Kwoniella newhampshirensis TaxID=1651941 RepID=A0AAW0Z4I7_9TREE